MGRPKGPVNALEHAQRCAAAQHRRPRRKPRRWKGQALAELCFAYELGAAKVDDLARYFGTSRGHMMRLAKRHGWKRRALALPEAARRHKHKYQEARRYRGRAFALEVVAGLP